MFTGLIEEVGVIRRVQRKGHTMLLTVEARKVLSDVQIGDSIAVNGVCLTVVAFDHETVSMDVMPETFRHTSLRELTAGSRVNLERAMSAQGRFGGHLVQGHVDGIGKIVHRKQDENAVRFTFHLEDTKLFRYIIPRGSIAIDGISLTVVTSDHEHFQVSIIPHTLAETVLHDKHPGDIVNIETDLMGKYVFHFLQRGDISTDDKQKPSRLTEQYLTEHGFM